MKSTIRTTVRSASRHRRRRHRGTYVEHGQRKSTCSYTDIDGDLYIDYFVDGDWQWTFP
jgi:hypothetical protein